MSGLTYLPNDDDQQWLLRELAEIVRARGSEPFLCAPIVQPTPEYFPDPVDSPAAALDRVTRRLMQYAGLGGLDAEIAFFEDTYIEGATEATSCKQIAGCFYGVEDGRCHFGVNAELSGDIEQLAGVMAHEVAHAYRAYHRLGCEDPDREELLTDVTTAYLGFGVLSVNNSFRFRTAGSLLASGWSTSATGYLPPQAHSFLLGGQLVARAADTRTRKAIYRQLETNQAALVKAAVTFFEEKQVDLATALGLPPPANRPAPRDQAEVLQPLEPYAAGTDDPQEESESPEPWNEGRPVFRIRESTVGPLALFEASVWGAGGYLLSWVLFRTWLGLVPFALVGLFLGLRRGLRSRHDVCSDRGCEAALDFAATRCPNCGGEIMGFLDSPRDRLSMEEKFAEEARRRSRRSE